MDFMVDANPRVDPLARRGNLKWHTRNATKKGKYRRIDFSTKEIKKSMLVWLALLARRTRKKWACIFLAFFITSSI